ncbi:MAG: FAD-dependent oxidoreductase [Rhodobacteraceae bacterium]|nr:FAD-dependent oxidoreductase [Paracoccaceae bacterium]
MGRTAIIGGGAIGLSLAYHLARRKSGNVMVLERNRLGSGTSWHAAGIVGPLRASPTMTRIAIDAISLFPRLKTEFGLDVGYRRTGGYWLARKEERLDELHRMASFGRYTGFDASMIESEELAESLPLLDASVIVGAMRIAEDANVSPLDLCLAYAKVAKSLGVNIREHSPVTRILTENCAVRGLLLADGSTVPADRVVICAGAWSKRLAETAGVALPLQPVEHMYAVTEPIQNLPQPFPVVRDLDRGLYLKGDAGKLVFGGFEPNAKCWDPEGPDGDRPFLELEEDWDHFSPFMDAALELIPALETVGIRHFLVGPESFSADTRPLIGETPEVDGLFVAAGMNSVGVMSSAGIGAVLSDWIADGSPPGDLWEVDIARVDERSASDDHIRERMVEAVADAMALRWPYKQPSAGRGLRKSPLHDHWQQAGAVFGITGGWERGLWFARNESERNLDYSVGEQPWQRIADREAAEMMGGVAIADLSPLTKIDIAGRDAVRFLQHMATANMDVAHHRAVYTALLNDQGGIENDAVIARRSECHFRVTTGAATRRKDAAWFRRNASGFNVSVSDRTDSEVIVGVFGPESRKLLEQLSSDDWEGFPFATTRSATVAGKPIFATRMSFVGESGWELSIDAEHAGVVFDALRKGGATPLGHHALDGCRLEKGFRHWGHDIGSDVTPPEAGLEHAVDWSKAEFKGKFALEKHVQNGVHRRLILFNVSGSPLALHDEVIFENNRGVGLTTSGAKGPRTGLTLAFGLISVDGGESLAETCDRRFQIDIAGRRHPATALNRPPYDPSGRRMRTWNV